MSAAAPESQLHCPICIYTRFRRPLHESVGFFFIFSFIFLLVFIYFIAVCLRLGLFSFGCLANLQFANCECLSIMFGPTFLHCILHSSSCSCSRSCSWSWLCLGPFHFWLDNHGVRQEVEIFREEDECVG